MVIAEEVFAADAHVAPHGDSLLRFELPFRKANEKPHFNHEVSAKNLEDRYKKLIDDFAKKDSRDRLISGTGGEIVESDQLLGDILEAKRDTHGTKNRDASTTSDKESNNLLARSEIIWQAVQGKNRAIYEEGSTSRGDSPSKKQRRDTFKSKVDGMASISTAVRACDDAHFALERENWSSRGRRSLRRSGRVSKTELRNWKSTTSARRK